MTDSAEKIRPLLYVRLKLDRGGPAEWMRDLVKEEYNYLARRHAHMASGTIEQREFGWAQQALADLEDGLKGPMISVNLRCYRDGQALWLRDLVRSEHADLLEELGDLRSRGLPEDDTGIKDTIEELNWAVKIARDLDQGLIHLVGPDRDPR